MIIYILILTIELYFVSKILKFNFMSPVYLYLIFYLLTIILSLLYFYFYEDKISLYSFDYIKESVFLKTIKYHLIALMAFCVGVFVFYDLSTRKVKQLYNTSFIQTLSLKYEIPNSYYPFIHTLIVVIITLCAFSYGIKLFYREEYLIEKNTSFIILLKLLSFVAILVLGLIYRKRKNLSLIYFFIIMAIAIGTGSRQAVLYTIVYTLLIYMSSKTNRLDKLILCINVLFSFVLLSYLMTLRSLEFHGLKPYIFSLFDNSDNLSNSVSFNIYYTFIFGIFVSAKTVLMNTPNWSNIWISINPLPGKWVGWYEIANSLRANIYAPYSANGEIFTMGKLFTFIFFTVIGIVMSYFECRIRKFFSKGNRIFGFLIALFCILFIIFSFEYNLRASVRNLYYAFFIIIVYDFMSKYKFKLK